MDADPIRYRVRHRTTYSYDDDVTDSLGIAYAAPRDFATQQVLHHEFTVDPQPSDHSTDVDYYGNTVNYFQVTQPHQELDVESVSDVDVALPVYSRNALAQPWESARPTARPDIAESWQAMEFTMESPLAAYDDAAAAYAAESMAPGRPIGEAVTDLMHRIYEDFSYDKTATTVTSTIADVMSQRAGVCQDFAQVTLSCLRSFGLAVRYVSGYLATTPPPGKERVVGAGASHAWAAVWIPGEDKAGGWLAVDPTNDQWANNRYVTVAWGRDYSDVPPVRGVIFSEAKKSTLKVAVDVAVLDEATDG